jgi:D-alanine-D-alanine ligase
MRRKYYPGPRRLPSGSSLRETLQVGVVTGGDSSERDMSLLSGESVFASLQKQGIRPLWLDPVETTFIEDLRAADAAILAIAGGQANNGTLQGLLEYFQIPYTGSGVFASALAMNKWAAKLVAGSHGIRTLPSVRVSRYENYADKVAGFVFTVGLPVIVKPESEGGSLDLARCEDWESLIATVQDALQRNQRVLVEAFSPGLAVTVGVLSIGDKLEVLPPLETRALSGLHDYDSKRDRSKHAYVCPAPVDRGTEAALQSAALEAHLRLGCSGYSRSDFMVEPDGTPYWLEINTLPGLSTHGALATMAAVAGIRYDDLLMLILSSRGLKK